MLRQPWEPHLQHVLSPGSTFHTLPCDARQRPLPHQARAHLCPARDKQNHQAIFQNTGPQLCTPPHGLGTWKVDTAVEVILLHGCPQWHLPQHSCLPGTSAGDRGSRPGPRPGQVPARSHHLSCVALGVGERGTGDDTAAAATAPTPGPGLRLSHLLSF